MKLTGVMIPFVLAMVGAVGNALVTIGQKKATAYDNPFVFGAISLLLASVMLFGVSLWYPMKGVVPYMHANWKWFLLTATGLLLLNAFLYFLYRSYGASYYTLYAILAIATTSIGASVFVFDEKMNVNYVISLCFALLTIYFFMRGKMS